jgi:hypothetical protein
VQDNTRLIPHLCSISHQPIWAGTRSVKFTGRSRDPPGSETPTIIHEHGIEIDLDRIKSIRNVGPPTCKVEVQKFLGKVNYLRRFISNLVGKIDAFTPILRLKNDAEFT